MTDTNNKLTYDFSGMATAYDILCDDGRVIKRGAFDHQDGVRVPLVWRHGHSEIDNVLGHAILKATTNPPGMRAFLKINDTPNGARAKILVENKDLTYLSIWANKLKETQVGSTREVLHGQIREVSLVLSGANRGAFIDEVVTHSADGYSEVVEDAGIIGSGFEIELTEAESPVPPPTLDASTEGEDTIKHEADKTVGDILATFNERQVLLLSALMAQEAGAFEKDFTIPDGELPKSKSSDIDLSDMDKVYDSLNEEQRVVLAYLVEGFKNEVGSLSQESEEDGILMTQSIFANNNQDRDGAQLNHTAIRNVLAEAANEKSTSLKGVFLAHGITDIEYLFPEHKLLEGGAPHVVKPEDEWVETIMSGIHKSPFARTKTRYADLTEDEARARGYIKGNEKVEEVFPILTRTTEPQTVYKKQKLDRDDIVDITDFDVVTWLKGEMRMMLRNEIARAVLVGDGRSAMSQDKIDPTKIRPIWLDHEVYAPKVILNANLTVDQVIDEVVRAQLEYQGTGRPTFFASPQTIIDMLLLQDTLGRRIYPSRELLAAALNVGRIVEIPLFNGLTRVVGPDEVELLGMLVNLSDYNLGMDKMGQTAFFDDFDIDFNQYKYLYESRQSGALVRPKSAVIIERRL
jgi:HK97 family phage prohead protease